jgi:hypothetical protein
VEESAPVEEAPPVAEPTNGNGNDHLLAEQYLYLGTKLDPEDTGKVTNAYARFMSNLEETGKLVRMADGFETALIAVCDNPAVMLGALANGEMTGGVPPPAEVYLLPHIQEFCKAYRVKGGNDQGGTMIEVMQAVGFFCLSDDDQEENDAWKTDVVVPFVEGFNAWAAEKHVAPAKVEPKKPATMGTQDVEEELTETDVDAKSGDAAGSEDDGEDTSADSILGSLEDDLDDDEDLVEAG